MTKIESVPADGERRAIVGYRGQYLFAANYIYEALQDGDLDAIRIADPEAGRVDDIQIIRGSRLDAYQVKWGEYVNTFTFNDLITQKKDGKKRTPSLIAQLADGWMRLKMQHGQQSIRVHLVVRGIPSTNDQVGAGTPKHFQAFLRNCWTTRPTWCNNLSFNPPQEWRDAIERIKIASGLSESDFRLFVDACEFHFKQYIERDEKDIENFRRQSDVDRIAQEIFKIAGADRRIVELRRSDILERLNWKIRYSCKFKHEFPVDEVLYRPILATVEEIESNLKKIDKGYIVLLGTPGSGKSTTLTQTFRYKQNCRVVRYYAYVRDDYALARGEAENFLHDLYVSMRREARGDSIKEIPQTRTELLEAIHRLFIKFSEEWNSKKIKTLILIDGLDHIEREQNPNRSLVADLPLPEAIPSGIVFLLGSQKIELAEISPRIIEHVKEVGRTIIMQPLTSTDIYSIIEASNLLTRLTVGQRETVLRLSNGHPLALSYLLKKLCPLDEDGDPEIVLGSTDPYSGHIEQDYEVYWKKLPENCSLHNLLGLLCRVRGVIDLETVCTWSGEDDVKQLIESARHYFYCESETRWFFFHNSFRQFLLKKTSLNTLGKYDVKKDSQFHRLLADSAAATNASQPWAWEELYHCAQCEDYDRVLSLFTQDRFRQQYYFFRSFTAILEDISIGLKVSAVKGACMPVLRALLIEQELNERTDATKDIDIQNLLLLVNDVEIAVDTVVKGRELLIAKDKVLEFCSILINIGELSIARRLFNLSEPCEMLCGIVEINSYHVSDSVLKPWVDIAHFFRPIDKIVESIYSLKVDIGERFPEKSEDEYREEEMHATKYLREYLIYRLIQSIHAEGDRHKLEKLKSILTINENAKFYLFNFDLLTLSDALSGQVDLEQGLSVLEHISVAINFESLDDSSRIEIAECFYRLKEDSASAERWLVGISQPSCQDSYSSEDLVRLRIFYKRIALNRMFSALGRPVDPIDAVPNCKSKSGMGGVLFERMLVLVANLWGKAWRGEFLSPPLLIKTLKPAICLFNRSWQSTREWTLWYYLESNADQFMYFLICAVSDYGKTYLEELAKEFYSQWDDVDVRKFWSPSLKRSVALELYRNGIHAKELINLLEQIDGQIFTSHNDPFERAQECKKQIEAWVDVGRRDKAINLITKIKKFSFGIYHDKDYQFEQWIELAKTVTDIIPDEMIPRMKYFVSAQVDIFSHHRNAASYNLLTLLAKHSPGWALRVRRWLIEKRGAGLIESFEGILCGLASRLNWTDATPLIIVVSHIILPFQRSFHESLPQAIGYLVGKIHKHNSKDVLRYLENAIKSQGYPSNRVGWWAGLKNGLTESGADCSWLDANMPSTEKTNVSDENTALLSSGELLKSSEILKKVKSFDALRLFLKNVSEIEKLEWLPILKALCGQFSIDQIRYLVTNYSVAKDLSCLEVLVRRLLALGAREYASELVAESYDKKPSHDWYRRYGGGSRLIVASMLVSIDEEFGRQKSLELFVSDYLSSYRYPRELISHFDEIIPVVFKTIPPLELWNELEEHIYQLFEFIQTENEPPNFYEPINCSNESIAFDLLFEQISSQTTDMRNESLKGVAFFALSGSADEIIVQRLQEVLSQDDDPTAENYLSILDSIAFRRRDFALKFTKNIQYYCNSAYMNNRIVAEHIVSILSLELPQKRDGRKVIPTFYHLEFPEIPMSDRSIFFDTPPKGEVLPDTWDVAEMIRPFGDAFRLLSNLSGFTYEKLVYRAANLMPKIRSKEAWSSKAEKLIGSFLEDIEFMVPYRRPRPEVALYAFSFVVAELTDAGRINRHSVAELQAWLTIHDPYMTLINAIPCPEWLLQPVTSKEKDFGRSDWVIDSEESERRFSAWINETPSVLAERSRFVVMDWKRPTETREAIFCHPSLNNPRYYMFPRDKCWRPSDYPNLQNVFDIFIPSIAISGVEYENRYGWIALNPLIAKKMGWVLDNSGVFRWVDANGNVMVESIYWKNGCLSYAKSYGNDDVCSVGWEIVATSQAVFQLQEFFPDWSMVARVERYKDDELD